MSKLQLLNGYVTERLTAAATEISIAIETTIVELHEEISRSTEENDRLRRLLDLVFKPEIKLHRAGLYCLVTVLASQVSELLHGVERWLRKMNEPGTLESLQSICQNVTLNS